MSLVTTLMKTFTQTFGASDAPKTVLNAVDYFNNIEPIHCPFTSFQLMTKGCEIVYSGGMLSITAATGVVEATYNHSDVRNLEFCLKASTASEVVTQDGFSYT